MEAFRYSMTHPCGLCGQPSQYVLGAGVVRQSILEKFGCSASPRSQDGHNSRVVPESSLGTSPILALGMPEGHAMYIHREAMKP